MLRNYPEGSNLTILDAVYHKPRKDDTTGKWSDSSITILYKDNDTGIKHHEVINKPEYEFHVANDDVYVPHHLDYIEKEKTHSVKTEYRNLEKEIARITGQMDLFYDNINNGNAYANRMMHYHPRIFASDMHIEDYYRAKFDRIYANPICNINKSFLDIEVDGIDMIGDFPTAEDSPINATCFMNLEDKQVYSFLLRNLNNPSMVEFEEGFTNETFDKLKKVIVDKVGYKNYIRYGLSDLQYNVMFYDDEIELIQDIFTIVNRANPDFLYIWNMSFDIPFIINRLAHLGCNPADIICPPEYENKEAYYYIDEKNLDKFEERGDFARISSNTVYLCQLIQFASRRKGQSAFKSMKLDDIGKAVAGIGKVDYHKVANSVVELPYKDYELFWIYNILDVVVQASIEHKTNDGEYTFNKCIANNTRYSKAHRQTVYLANRASKSYYNMGYIMGNNINKSNPKPDSKFKGAYIADPSLVDNYAKLKLNGYAIDVYDNLDDYDYARLYPSVIQEFNMSAPTQVGKIHIPNIVNPNENPFGDLKFDRGGAYIEDIQSHNYLEFGHRYLNLASYSEIIDDIREFFTTRVTPSGPLEVYNGGVYSPLIKIVGPEVPLVRLDTNRSPLIRYSSIDIEAVRGRLGV